MRYTDFILSTTDPHIVKADGRKRLTFDLRLPGVFDERTPCEADVKGIEELTNEAIAPDADWRAARKLGEALGSVLLPPKVWNVLNNRITQAEGEHEGVRVRLLLSGNELRSWPWEFILFNRGGGEPKISDFLGLMPNVSIVRHAATPLPAWRVKAKIPVKVMVALSGSGRPKLKVADELALIVKALEGNTQIVMDSVEHAQRGRLPNKMRPAHLFHFAGHGKFETVQSPIPGAYEGKASIILEDEYGDEDPLDAELLAVQLRDAGVRVAVLGACQTAQQDDVGAWSSVAETLLKAELGAVVGMQFPIHDQSALCFAQRFYGALSLGLSIDEAVAAGRIAVAASGDSRDWATPVLYLRSPDGVIFPELESASSLAADRDKAKLDIQLDIGVLEGSAVGLKINQVKGDTIDAKKIEDIGRALGNLSMSIGGKIGLVTKTGSVTGVEIGSANQRRRRSKKQTKDRS